MSDFKQYDDVIVEIADYVHRYQVNSKEAIQMARICLLDSLGCAMLALSHPACQRMMGSSTGFPHLERGLRVPGTNYQLNLLEAVFNTSMMVRWLDYNDTWLAKEWGHPSDNIGALLMSALHLNQNSSDGDQFNWTIGKLLPLICQAYEIQGVLALENAFNQLGLDHVVLVKIATTAVASKMLGGGPLETCNALSQAWIDGQSLRTYRHAPNTGSRKCWAAADASSRGIQLALWSLQGEPGYPTALTAPKWGFYDVYQQGRAFSLNQSFATYVIENVLFKVAYPAEFHSQTIIECALKLRDQIAGKAQDIKRIMLTTHEAADRIINKVGPLNNPSDRDHCLQYICAIALHHGQVTDEHYLDQCAENPEIDRLRSLMEVQVLEDFTRDYFDPKKRSIANALQIEFKDGSLTEKITVHYPLGHRTRRQEALPLIQDKCGHNLSSRLPKEKVTKILALFHDSEALDRMSVENFLDLYSHE